MVNCVRNRLDLLCKYPKALMSTVRINSFSLVWISFALQFFNSIDFSFLQRFHVERCLFKCTIMNPDLTPETVLAQSDG